MLQDFFDPPSNTIDNNSDHVDQKQDTESGKKYSYYLPHKIQHYLIMVSFSTSESHDIPEGFFDDPKVDAKVSSTK